MAGQWWLLAASLIASVALIWWFLRRHQENQWRSLPPIRLTHAVVMAHGILGFDKIGIGGVRQTYFRGVWRYLEALGVQVTYPTVPMVGSIERRAQALATHIESIGPAPVIIIAHSMGGLDARYAIQSLGLADRVAALVTIGTPHRGTSLADLSEHVVPRMFRWFLRRVSLHGPAVDDLTRRATAHFNASTPDHPNVSYYSVIAHATWRTLVFNPALWAPAWFVRRREGPNDGLVATSSQRWGTVLFEVDADHWSQIGWTLRFDSRGMYARVLRELAKEGH